MADTNTFEKMKVVSIDLPVKKHYLPVKEGVKEIPRKAGNGLLLSINILEAMYQDTNVGNDANAAAGFELMLEPYQRAPILGLENDLSALSDNVRGLIGHTCTFPIPWSNLHSSWNGAFCTNFTDFPFFLAKLFNPSTSGTYHDDPSLYLFPRVFTLWLHIHFQMFQRAANHSATPPGLKWESPLLSLLWGKVNLAAAREFRARIDAVIATQHGGVHPDRRDGMGSMFASMKNSMIPASQRRFTLIRVKTATSLSRKTSSSAAAEGTMAEEEKLAVRHVEQHLKCVRAMRRATFVQDDGAGAQPKTRSRTRASMWRKAARDVTILSSAQSSHNEVAADEIEDIGELEDAYSMVAKGADPVSGRV